jgi:hypothetical protein
MATATQRARVADEQAAQKYAYEQGWTDGLPIVPATPERVATMLGHAGVAPEYLVGQYHVRNRIISAEKVAINAVMAGCAPEHFPVVTAAIEALTDDRFHLNHIASTSSPYPLFVINGPIVEKLTLHSGAAVLAPGHRANAVIGRAISLTLSNCLEAHVGGVQQGVLGMPSRVAGGVIAEAPGNGWEPLSELRGAPKGASAITALPHYMGGPQEIWAHPSEAFPSAESVATLIAAHYGEYGSAGFGSTNLVLVSPPMQRRFLADGWSKTDLRGWLRNNARVSFAKLMRRPGPGGIWPANAAEAGNGALLPKAEDYEKYWHLGRFEKSDPLPVSHPRNDRAINRQGSEFVQGDLAESQFEIAVAGAEDGPMLAALGRCYPLKPAAVTKAIRSPLCN